MDRRRLVLLAAALPVAGLVQAQATRKRIGYLSAETAAYEARRIEIVKAELRKLGYVEGDTFVVEARFAEGRYDRLPALAAELVAGNVDVIVASGSKAGFAAKSVTTVVPIVVSNMGDAVKAGFTGSYAQPGGNVTGMSQLGTESIPKQLDLLRQVKPRLSIVAVFVNPANPNASVLLDALRRAAASMHIALEPIEVRHPSGLPAAFATAARTRADGLLVLSDTMFAVSAREIADRAAKQGIASAGTYDYARAGGLIGYSSDRVESTRQLVVDYVDRILKGARPSDLPVQQPTEVKLAVNLRSAAALGLAIPPSLLLRADDVIQ